MIRFKKAPKVDKERRLRAQVARLKGEVKQLKGINEKLIDVLSEKLSLDVDTIVREVK